MTAANLEQGEAETGGFPELVSRLACLLQDPRLLAVCRNYEFQKGDRTSLGLNIFTIVSNIYYRENFHSDLLAAFLDMYGAHGEGNLFLRHFLQLLRESSPAALASSLDASLFNDYRTTREEGHIDIGIFDNDTKNALIIENKIYNAVDQWRQLPSYVQNVEAHGFKVLAIVYLSMDGQKEPSKDGWTEEDRAKVPSRLIKVAAFTKGKKPDLLTRWVGPGIQDTANADALLILRQYGRLLQHLGANMMNNSIMQQFHELMLKGDNYATALALRDLLARMPELMQQSIVGRYASGCLPFDRAWTWKPGVAVFGDFIYGNGKLAVDFCCAESEVSVQLLDRNPSNGKTVMEQALNDAGLAEEFTYDENRGRYVKTFEYPAKESALFEFLDRLLLPGFQKIAPSG
jgi:hypothetical protein